MKKSNSPHSCGSLFLILKDGYYYIHGTHEGKRIRVTTKCRDLRSAKKFIEDFWIGLSTDWRPNRIERDEWHSVAAAVCQRHRTHSKARRIPFTINKGDVYALMKASDFRCQVSGISFARKPPGESTPDPWSPSIDRIDNRHGYVRGNIRVVSTIANLAMNRWGYDALLRLSSAVVANAMRPIPEKLAQTSQIENDNNAQVIELAREIAETPSSRWGGVAR